MKLIIKVNSIQGENQIIGSSNACQIIRDKKSATKVLKTSSIDMIVHEYQILKQLEHPNIIRLASEKPFKILKELDKVGLKLELGHIDLFQFLQQTHPSRLNTSTIKDFFRQIGGALLYLHEEKHIAHNDIKLENILLFFKKGGTSNQTNVTAKLIDFGLASESELKVKQILNTWQTRSPNNLPPEILELTNGEEKIRCPKKIIEELNIFSNGIEKFDLSKCDVFQFGLTLFNALFLSNAFVWKNGDSSYKYFINKTPDQFWNLPLNTELLSLIKIDSSPEQIDQLIDLFNSSFCYNPSQRFSIKQILNHPWFSSF